MPSLIPRALAAVLAPGPALPMTMPPGYQRPAAPLMEIVIDSTAGSTRYVLIKKPLVSMVTKRV